MLGRAEISKEKVLSEEWDKSITDRREELERKSINSFFETLQKQVNSEVTEAEAKKNSQSA